MPEKYPFARLCKCPTFYEGAFCIAPYRYGEIGYVNDLQGMGIPLGGLPDPLAGFSVNGWTLETDNSGKIVMAANGQVRNERGCRASLEIDYEAIRQCFCCLSGLQATCFQEKDGRYIP